MEVGDDDAVAGVDVGLGLFVRAADCVPPVCVGDEVPLYSVEPVNNAEDTRGEGDGDSVMQAVGVKEGNEVTEGEDLALLGDSLVMLGEEEGEVD